MNGYKSRAEQSWVCSHVLQEAPGDASVCVLITVEAVSDLVLSLLNRTVCERCSLLLKRQWRILWESRLRSSPESVYHRLNSHQFSIVFSFKLTKLTQTHSKFHTSEFSLFNSEDNSAPFHVSQSPFWNGALVVHRSLNIVFNMQKGKMHNEHHKSTEIQPAALRQ